VLGADGSLTGYAGGLPLKAALLRFEQENTVPGLFAG
jgi:methylated-DNA-[protein]-cysteine S-methyltransferase